MVGSQQEVGEMGLSTGLADAAEKLRQNIDDGVEVKAAVRAFAEDVEKVAKEAREAARQLLESRQQD